MFTRPVNPDYLGHRRVTKLEYTAFNWLQPVLKPKPADGRLSHKDDPSTITIDLAILLHYRRLSLKPLLKLIHNTHECLVRITT